MHDRVDHAKSRVVEVRQQNVNKPRDFATTECLNNFSIVFTF